MSSTISGQTQGFDALVSGQAAVVQASAQPVAPIDFSVGSVLRAVAEATAWIGLWLQALILQVLSLTRAATSNGNDLDTWMADFTLRRIGATAATGAVTFARYTPTQLATIPPGTIVTTGDGTEVFAVVADTSNAAWNAGLGVYQIPVNTTSVSVTVQASTAGSAGNVAAGQISLLSSPISGVDTVVNAGALGGGTDAESDAAFRQRFATFINTRSLATNTAIGYAVSTAGGVHSWIITENYDYDGQYDPGSFYVVVDDGSGNPPSSLISAVSAAVDATRGCGVRFSVFPPALVSATIVMTITTQTGYDHGTAVSAVDAALTSYVNGLNVGVSLSYLKLAQLAFNASPAVTGVTPYSLNGGAGDLDVGPQQVVRIGTLAVS